MSIHKFYNAFLYLGGYDLQANHSMVRVTDDYDELEKTAFGNASHRFIAGLEKQTITADAYLDYGSSLFEDVLRQFRGQVKVYLITPDGAALGDKAFFGSALVHTGNPMGGSVGAMHKTSWAASGGSGYQVAKGQVFHAAGATTSSSNAAGVQLGAVAAGQRVYAAIQVLSFSGTSPTLDVTVKSDDNSGLSSPTTRATFTQATGITSEFISAAGAITDDWWSAYWTIGGSSTPTFSFVVAIGIF